MDLRPEHVNLARSPAPSEASSKRFLGGAWPCLLMLVAVVLAYAPALTSGFLNYDDPWLLEHNPFLAPAAWHAPRAMLFDFSPETRLALGAEYLPVRDLVVWLETRMFGLWAPGLHAVSVALYVLAVLLMRGVLLRTLGPSLWTEFAALAFALHPVHVESVAWLSGQKDVLALCFVSAALFVHAGGSPRRTWLVPLLVLLASLSKSMSVAVLALLMAEDLLLRRALPWRVYAGASLAVALAMLAHVHVGSLVGMLAEPLGGSRRAAVISMGPVWLRYLQLCLMPWHLSIAHDVPEHTTWNVPALLGNLFVLGTLLGSALSLRRGARKPAFVWLWFFAPLVPVSQVLAPLQNRMADRYLWLSVMAPCLLGAWAFSRLEGARRARIALVRVAAVALCLGLWGATFARAVTFSDSVLLFADGTQKTRFDTDAPYQLGKALEEQGRDREAMAAFQEVLARAPSGPEPDARRASNNLARLLARHGELPEAERVLRAALARFPGDPKLRSNLVKVLRGMGRAEEAAQLER